MRVAVVGLGPIGIELVKALAGRAELTLVAVCDAAPSLAGMTMTTIRSAQNTSIPMPV